MGLLRDMFGPSKDEIWSQLSSEIGGAYQPDGYFLTGKLTLTHAQWTITADTHTVSSGKSSVTYTRFRAPYVNADGFRFNVYTNGPFSQFALRLSGLKDVEIGDAGFDALFIVKTTSEESIRRLLSNQTIRSLLTAEPDVHFEVKDDEGTFRARFPQGVDELYFQAVGVIKDPDRLKDLFELFALVLDGLCEIGSAYASSPGVTAE